MINLFQQSYKKQQASFGIRKDYLFNQYLLEGLNSRQLKKIKDICQIAETKLPEKPVKHCFFDKSVKGTLGVNYWTIRGKFRTSESVDETRVNMPLKLFKSYPVFTIRLIETVAKAKILFNKALTPIQKIKEARTHKRWDNEIKKEQEQILAAKTEETKRALVLKSMQQSITV